MKFELDFLCFILWYNCMVLQKVVIDAVPIKWIDTFTVIVV